ncbi:MAG: TetR family transcriptional regulator [Sneathiella sp.]|nr:TetR family transcriptional regulator [Sneathiella sp.]
MNKMLGKRAVSAHQKNLRREALLTAARELFVEAGFFDVSMAMIAKRAAMAKGTVYLYYKTKEELFLELSRRDLEIWFEDLISKLQNLPENPETHAFVKAVMATLEGRQTAIRLLSLLHLVLEQNVSREEVLNFKLDLLNHSEIAGAEIERVLPFVHQGQGVEILAAIHCQIIGWGQMTDISPVVNEVLEDKRLSPLRIDFAASLQTSLLCMVEGIKKLSSP